MSRLILTAFVLGMPLLLSAQDSLVTNPNIYTVINEVDNCNSCITVSDTTGLREGMQLFIYQTFGASIDESDAGTFGNISSIADAGHYEWNAIASRDGFQLCLERQLQYDYEPGAGLQAIGFKVYEEAYVQSILQAKEWDGNTGGVIILMASDSLIIDAPILADGAGFRGGASVEAMGINCSVITFNNRYFYGAGNWRGAPKGEGLSAIISGKEYGRGAQANGGGGGNNHNSGGGGGGHLTPGGIGGENNEPSFGGCDGFFPGRGGKALPADSTRLYLGGGGGAGHRNNNNDVAGGNGGGIIILQAPHIRFASGFISANGRNANSPQGDGAGGGGAGGTIMVLAKDIQGNLDLSAKGGDGGSVDNNNENRCFGPGGGGSGGRLLTNLMGINADLSVGIAGQTTNSNSCGIGNNGAENGQAGIEAMLTSLTQGPENVEFAFLDFPENASHCSGETLFLNVDTQGGADYQWQIFDNGWTDLIGGIYTGINTPNLGILMGNGTQRFRLVATPPCGGEPQFTEAIEVSFINQPTASFIIQQNGADIMLTNNSTNGSSYLWDFGDMNSSTAFEPDHSYTQSGSFLVSLTVFNACDTVQSNQLVTIEGLSAGFEATNTTGCAPFTVQFTDLSTGIIEDRLWLFPGATPNQSNEINPEVTYNTPGNYNVQLIVFDAIGSDTLSLPNYIEVLPDPQSQFDFVLNGQTVNFNFTGAFADNYSWDFGDMNSSMEANPSHDYALAGTYLVTLTVSNICGEASFNQEITIESQLSASINSSSQTGCAPKSITFSDQSTGPYTQRLWSFPGATPETSTEETVEVVYNSAGSYEATLTITDDFGNSSNSQILIEISPSPSVAFDFVENDLTVSFNNLSNNATSFNWQFGDGQSSTEANPVHTYDSPGIYEVTLTAQNGACLRAIGATVVLDPLSTNDLAAVGIKIYPNPTTDFCWIEGFNQGNIHLYTPQGQLLGQWQINSDKEYWSPDPPAAGTYYLLLQRAEHQWLVPVIFH